MKPRILSTARLSFSLATAIAALLAARSAHAANYYWDTDGAVPGSGGATPSGSWSSSGTTWSADSTGSSAAASYTTTAADDLFLSAGTDATGAYAISLTDAQNAKSLTFEEGAPTISGTGGIITLGGTGGNINVGGSLSAVIGNATTTVIGGSVGLTKLGTGTLTLNGSDVNTFAGGLNVSAGTLALDYSNLATPTDLINSGNALTIGGGRLNISGKNSATNTQQTVNGTTLSAGNNIISMVKGASATSSTLNMGALTVNEGSITTINPGTIWATATPSTTEKVFITSYNGNALPGTSGTANWRNISAGVFYRQSASAGSLRWVSVDNTGQLNALPAAITGVAVTTNDPTKGYSLSGAVTFTTTAGNTYGLYPNSGSANSLTLAAGGTWTTNGIVQLQTGVATIIAGTGTSYITIGSEKNLVIGTDNTGGVIINAPIANNGNTSGTGGTTSSVTVAGTNPTGTSGTVTFQGGANTYTGTTYVMGTTLSLAKAASTISIPGNLVMKTGATLATTTAASNQIADTASVTFEAGSRLSAGIVDTVGAVTVTGAVTGTPTPAFNLGSSSNLTMSSLTLNSTAGGGSYSLAANGGNSTMTINGAFTMNDAIYQLQQTTANTNTAKIVLNGNFTSTGSSQLTLGGGTGTITQLDLGASVRTFNVTGTMSIAPDVIGTGGGINKTGTGALTLSGANSAYTGTTTVGNGTVKLGSANALGTTAGNTTITSGATLDLNGQTIAEPFGSIAGTGVSATGAIINSSATAASITGTISTGSAVSIGGTGNITFATFTNNGAGPTINKIGANTLTLSGTGDNSSVAANANAGVLVFGKTSTTGVHAVGNASSVGSGGTLQLGGSGDYQIYGAINLTVNNGGVFDLSGKNQNYNALAGKINLNGAGISSSGALINSAATTSTVTMGSGSVVLQTTSSVGGSGDMIIVGGTTLATGSVSGVGGLTKIGTGSLTLSTPTTYTGATTVNAGKLFVTGSITDNHTMSVAPTVASGAGLSFINNAANTPTNFNSLSLGSATGTSLIGLDLGTSSDTIATSAPATATHNIAFQINPVAGFGPGTYNLISAPSGLTSSSPTYSLAGAPAGYNYTINSIDSLVQLVVATSSAPAALYWQGNVNGSWGGFTAGGNSNWSLDGPGTSNATTAPGAASSVYFSADNAAGPVLATTLDSNLSINDLRFLAAPTGVSSVTIAPGTPVVPGTANSLTLAPSSSSDGINLAQGSGAVTISAAIVLGAPQTWSVDSSTPVSGTASSLTVSGAISGAAPNNLTFTTVSGTTPIILSGVNTYSGASTVSANTVVQGEVAGAFSPNTSWTVDGTLNTGAFNQTTGSLVGGSGIVQNGSATNTTLTIGNDNIPSATFGGTIQNGSTGTLSIVKVGTGAISLTGTNTFTGNLAINAGTVRAGSASSAGNGAQIISNSTAAASTFASADATALTFSKTFSSNLAAGGITFGDATGTGDMTFTGDLTRAGGATTRSANVAGATTVTFNGNLLSPGTPTAATTFTKGGTGTLVIKGTGSGSDSGFSGVIVTGGTLAVTRLANLGSACSLGKATGATAGTVSITLDGSTLRYIDGGAAASSTNRLLQIGSTTTAAVGTIRNDATSTSETVTFSNTAAIAYGTVDQTRTLVLGGTNTGTNTLASLVGNNGTAAVSLTKQDAGTWALTGTNTYTGNTTVGGGILAISNAFLSDGADVSVAVGASMALNYSGTDTIDELFIDGNAKSPGTYGATGSGATNIDNVHFSGTGTLTVTTGPSADPYLAWSGIADFNADTNGDGVKNGLAWLLGAANKNENAINRLPAVTVSGGGLVMSFNCLPLATRGSAKLKVSYSSDLAIWTPTVDVVPDADDAVPDNNVTFVVGAGPAGPPQLNTVTATIDSAAAAAGKLFGRLEAVTP